ncbi:heme exporter protein CcmD [Wenxinia saemankumensis]|uniref:Heme exporter protein D n=1 Tax=Wenxinia saemankumensis TaxID=1447782 RepID=A0A1M6EX24_9RHOB|nr:heme exporter protein D [Wenxinia saemankumensis]
MPDLGRYAAEVLASYGVSLVLLVGLVWASYARSARVARELREVERDGR